MAKWNIPDLTHTKYTETKMMESDTTNLESHFEQPLKF